MPIKSVSRPASNHWPNDTIPTSIRARRNSSKKSMRHTRCSLISKPNGSMMQHEGLAHTPMRNPTVIPSLRTHMHNKIHFLSNIPTSKEGTTPISKDTIILTEARKATPNTTPGKTPISTIIQVNTADGQQGTSGCTRSIANSRKNS